ncbi:xanthine dehydrogenase family protein molybdopterin-binding subunit [Arenibacter sp. BSSL-BM3]|uniref:Xanthine dehydrogenase family protein molybdopterin-binding subunit n=1 Tax=Arenibacter arenosicollis TaxID=2762274 RepID=A0ABR7QR59_9FLAO|nr:molybdopterin cofactor-binding domain-containing protein [Arenibacter arenosicollis]MBC8769549.1 xanthine dehydrogenase family protein molybdopterin-binding subunit [Arenibacter arenosicollis]
MTEIPLQSRRKFIKNMGYISVGFSLLGACIGSEDPTIASRATYDGKLPGSIGRAKTVNAWLEILEDGNIRVLSGKVELGQGLRTAIQQVAAEELDMDLDKVQVHLAETGLTPNEGYTGASASIQNSAMSVRYAAATARQELLGLASKKLNTPIDDLLLFNGIVKSKLGNKSLTFAEILEGEQIDKEVIVPVPIKNKAEHRYVGKSIARTDIEGMVRGQAGYIQNLRFPGMVHARVVRPPGYESKLLTLDETGLKAEVPGVLKTVVKGSFVGVITEREHQAIKAEQYLRNHSEWTTSAPFPQIENLFTHIKEIANDPETVRNEGNVEAAFKGVETIKARYTKPYIKHASLGPACGWAMFDGEVLHIWSHSQGIYPLREALATMLSMEAEKIHIIAVPGAGCFGHSTADDAATDAALLAMEYPNTHVRVQWSRQDEHLWDPYGPAMIAELEASLDENNRINSWKADVWTDSHSQRPNKDAGTVLAARYLETPFTMKSRGYLGGGHRNADPYYNIPNMKLNAHYYNGPFRVSSLRSLGSFTNIFAIESLMDSLAEKAGQDPLDFRLKHLEDERAIAVIQKVKELTASQNIADNQGVGYAFMRYKNTDAYIAMAAKVAVDKVTGNIELIKMWAAVDVGEVINMDGITNQIEGGLIQAASWTLKEQLTFNTNEITSTDWIKYPILRFSEIPEVEVAIINRPEEDAKGVGEVPMPPTPAAIANAIYKACGKRVYDLPITPEKILNG